MNSYGSSLKKLIIMVISPLIEAKMAVYTNSANWRWVWIDVDLAFKGAVGTRWAGRPRIIVNPELALVPSVAKGSKGVFSTKFKNGEN